jgi:hypothetical protein
MDILYKIGSAVKGIEFVHDMMSYITLISCWCDIIILNVYAPPKDKSVDTDFYLNLHGVENK